MTVFDDGALDEWCINPFPQYAPVLKELVDALHRREEFIGKAHSYIPWCGTDMQSLIGRDDGQYTGGTPYPSHVMWMYLFILGYTGIAIQYLQEYSGWCDSDGSEYSGYNLADYITLVPREWPSFLDKCKQSLEEHRYKVNSILVTSQQPYSGHCYVDNSEYGRTCQHELVPISFTWSEHDIYWGWAGGSIAVDLQTYDGMLGPSLGLEIESWRDLQLPLPMPRYEVIWSGDSSALHDNHWFTIPTTQIFNLVSYSPLITESYGWPPNYEGGPFNVIYRDTYGWKNSCKKGGKLWHAEYDPPDSDRNIKITVSIGIGAFGLNTTSSTDISGTFYPGITVKINGSTVYSLSGGYTATKEELIASGGVLGSETFETTVASGSSGIDVLVYSDPSGGLSDGVHLRGSCSFGVEFEAVAP